MPSNSPASRSRVVTALSSWLGTVDSDGVIVGHHNGDGSGQHGSLKHFSRGKRGLISGTDRHNRIGGHLVLAIQVKSDKMLTAVVRQD